MEAEKNTGIEYAKSLVNRLAAVHTLELEEYEQLISAQIMQHKKLIFSESKFTERMFSFADLSKSAAAAKMTVCIAEFENLTSMRNAMF